MADPGPLESEPEVPKRVTVVGATPTSTCLCTSAASVSICLIAVAQLKLGSSVIPCMSD